MINNGKILKKRDAMVNIYLDKDHSSIDPVPPAALFGAVDTKTIEL